MPNTLIRDLNKASNGERLIGFFLAFTSFCIFGTLFATPFPTLACTLLMLFSFPLVLLNSKRRALLFAFFQGPERWFVWSFIAWPVSYISVSVISGGWSDGRYLNNPARFALSIPIAVLFATQKVNFKWLFWGVAVACVSSATWGAYDIYKLRLFRATGLINNEIYFGNLATTASCFAIVYASMASQLASKWRISLLVCAILGLAGGLASFSRSSVWALFPLLFLAFIRLKDTFHKWIVTAMAATLVCSAIGLATSQYMRQITRISEAANDVTAYKKNVAPSSIGDRFEMWRASWLMFKSKPIQGVGTRNFQSEYDKLTKQGLVRPGDMPYNQAHSQIMHTLGVGGIIFFAGYMFMLLAPACYFYKKFRHQDANYTIRIASMLGLSTCIAFFGFGLTNAIFDIQLYSTVYPVLLASLAGICHYELAAQGQ